jgi:hypothetical protein
MSLFKKIWNLFFPVNTTPIESEKEETPELELKDFMMPITSPTFTLLTLPVIIEEEEGKEETKEIKSTPTKKKKSATKNAGKKEKSDSKPTGKKRNVQGVPVEKRGKKK